ncbi:MAG: hypothetical protein ACRBFS_08590 [Aureispira sp.]
MKSIVQPFFLLLGWLFAFGALWMNWVNAAVTPLPNQDPTALFIKNYPAYKVLGEDFSMMLMVFYGTVLLVTLIASSTSLSRLIVIKIFKGMLLGNLLLIARFIYIMITGSYLQAGHVFLALKEGLLIWLMANALTIRWLWKFSYPVPFQTTEELLDDLSQEET